MDNKDRLEARFRGNLYNFEYQPEAGSWEKIARKLDRKGSEKKRGLYLPFAKKTAKSQQFGKIARIAAALLLLLLAGEGIRIITQQQIEEITNPEFSSAGQSEEPRETRQKENAIRRNGLSLTQNETDLFRKTEKNVFQKKSPNTCVTHLTPAEPLKISPTKEHRDSTFFSPLPLRTTLVSGLLLTNASRKPMPRKSFFRNWRIGMGGGSIGLAGISNPLSAQQNNAISNDPLPDFPDKEKVSPSLPIHPDRSESTKIKHGIPLSFGISLSHPLTERWSVNTGLTYTYLPSRWQYKYTSGTAGRQRLHLVGIPLSVSYRLNDWKRPYCYATAGILAEVNVAGKIRTSHTTYHIRIPGLLWTVNARIGLACPLVRFLSVYGEAGVCYYFDYNSKIETIRSKDPFKVSGQIGLRLNF